MGFQQNFRARQARGEPLQALDKGGNALFVRGFHTGARENAHASEAIVVDSFANHFTLASTCAGELSGVFRFR